MWQSIETAPKGGGADSTTNPAWVEPPRILLLFAHGMMSVGYWDWYYAEGGDGCTHGVAWVEPVSGELLKDHYGLPTHWMPLPDPPSPKEGA